MSQKTHLIQEVEVNFNYKIILKNVNLSYSFIVMIFFPKFINPQYFSKATIFVALWIPLYLQKNKKFWCPINENSFFF